MSLGVERYRGAEGYGDRRPWFAHPDREISDKISRGERRARKTFWRLLHAKKTPDPDGAIRLALGIGLGPLPGLDGMASVGAEAGIPYWTYWTPERLKEIAERWSRSPRTIRCATAKVRQAQHHIEAASPAFARALIEVALDPTAPAAARVMAASKGLALAGAQMPTGNEIPAVSHIVWTGSETVPELEALLPRVVQLEPDTNKARLMIEGMMKRLAILDPDRYGTKVQHQISGHLGVVAGTLADLRARKQAALPATEVANVLIDSEDEAA